MYEHLRGRVVKKHPTSVVVEVAGVGWFVETSLRTSGALKLGAEATLLVHHRQTEDSVRLFGFAAEEERDLFRRLLRISGVGPAHALALCSGSAPEQVWGAIASADERRLSSSKGIGPKIAQRLITELRDEAARRGYGKDGVASAADAAAGHADAGGDDAIEALMILGYTEGAAAKATAAARKKLGPAAVVEDVIKEALRA
jgi:holliday junction DNA helicase RuvA